MPQTVALVGAVAVVLLIGCMAASFTVLAFAIRRDFRTRFERVSDALERQANTIMRDIFGRDTPS